MFQREERDLFLFRDKEKKYIIEMWTHIYIMYSF